MPHGEGHSLRSDAGAPAPGILELERELVSDRYELLRHGGGGAPTILICGAVRFDHPAARNLVEILPPAIHLEPSGSPQLDWLQATLRLMAAEARLRPGGEAVITRLADILVVQAIRSWLESDPAAQTGWLGALQDKQIGRAIALIHREPARQWTVAGLARELAMSRSAFAARYGARRRARDALRRTLAHAGRRRLAPESETPVSASSPTCSATVPRPRSHGRSSASSASHREPCGGSRHPTRPPSGEP